MILREPQLMAQLRLKMSSLDYAPACLDDAPKCPHTCRDSTYEERYSMAVKVPTYVAGKTNTIKSNALLKIDLTEDTGRERDARCRIFLRQTEKVPWLGIGGSDAPSLIHFWKPN